MIPALVCLLTQLQQLVSVLHKVKVRICIVVPARQHRAICYPCTLELLTDKAVIEEPLCGEFVSVNRRVLRRSFVSFQLRLAT